MSPANEITIVDIGLIGTSISKALSKPRRCVDVSRRSILKTLSFLPFSGIFFSKGLKTDSCGKKEFYAGIQYHSDQHHAKYNINKRTVCMNIMGSREQFEFFNKLLTDKKYFDNLIPIPPNHPVPHTSIMISEGAEEICIHASKLKDIRFSELYYMTENPLTNEKTLIVQLYRDGKPTLGFNIPLEKWIEMGHPNITQLRYSCDKKCLVNGTFIGKDPETKEYKMIGTVDFKEKQKI